MSTFVEVLNAEAARVEAGEAEACNAPLPYSDDVRCGRIATHQEDAEMMLDVHAGLQWVTWQAS